VSYAEGKLHEITRGDQSKDPWYFLGAIAIPDRQRYDTYQLVSRLKNQYLRSLAPHGLLHERSVEAELKGKRLFHRIEARQGPLDVTLLNALTPQNAADLLNDLIDGLITTALSGCFYLVAIEQRLLYRKYFRIARSPAFIALTFLEQRACSRQDLSHEQGAFILDRGSAVDEQYDIMRFLSTRDQMSRDVAYDYDRLLLENPVSVVSSDCPQIQISDVLTYIVGKAIRENNPQWNWFQRVLPLIASRANGTRLNIGLSFYPPEATPPAFANI